MFLYITIYCPLFVICVLQGFLFAINALGLYVSYVGACTVEGQSISIHCLQYMICIRLSLTIFLIIYCSDNKTYMIQVTVNIHIQDVIS